MVWDKTCVMDKRMAFIVDYRSGDYCFAELCRRYGVSRRIGYKWRDRYEAEGPAGMVDSSPAPPQPGTAMTWAPAAGVVALAGVSQGRGATDLGARLGRGPLGRPDDEG